MEKEQKNPKSLEALEVAPEDHRWDEVEALQRIQQNLGWGALSMYSLGVDYSGNPQSYETYKLPIADILDGQPVIVPAALRAARERLGELQGTDKEKAETTLDFLESSLECLQKPMSDQTERDENVNDDPIPEPLTREPDLQQPAVAGETRAREIVSRLAGQGKIVPSVGYDSLTGFIAGLSTEANITVEGADDLSAVEYFTGLMESLPLLVPVAELVTATRRRAQSYEQVGRKIAQSLK